MTPTADRKGADGQSPPPHDLSIATWNVNGLRRFHPCNLKAGISLKESLEMLGGSGIVCFQETKLGRSELTEELALPPGWEAFFSFSQVKSNGGYSGTCTYVKKTVVGTVAAAEGLKGCCAFNRVSTEGGDDEEQEEGDCVFGCKEFVRLCEAALVDGTDPRSPEGIINELDHEGRIVMTDHAAFVLLNVYAPASREGRGDFKKKFHQALKLRCEALLARGRPLVVVGDLNACAARIDHCDPDPEFEAKFTVRWIQSLLTASAPASPMLVDTFRALNPNQRNAYTCWNTVTGARATNYGTRIDYILVSPSLSQHLKSAVIRPDVEGSDHCPVITTFKEMPPGVRPDDPKAPPLAFAAANLFKAKQSKLLSFLSRASSSEASSSPIGVPSGVPNSIRTSPAKQRSQGTKGGQQKQQRRLDHFFVKARNVTSTEVTEVEGSSAVREETTVIETAAAMASGSWEGEAVAASSSWSSSSSSQVADKDNAMKWKALFKPPPQPVCHHKEPAVERVVLKDGPNKGRRFHVCARPAGDPSHPLARCDFFQWATEPKRYIGQPPPLSQPPAKRRK